MKISLLTWLILMILCGNHVTPGEDFNLSKPSMQEQFQGVNGNMTLNGLRSGGVESKEKPEIFHLIKTGHRGKGSSGTANINHKTPASAQKSDVPVSARPSILVSICTALSVTLVLALIFPLPIPFSKGCQSCSEI